MSKMSGDIINKGQSSSTRSNSLFWKKIDKIYSNVLSQFCYINKLMRKSKKNMSFLFKDILILFV